MGDVGYFIPECSSGWPVSRCEPFDNYGASDDADVEEVELTAKFILWGLTGRRYGLCPVEISPPPVCACAGACYCRGCSILLPGPVQSVSDVLVDDESFDDYFLRGDELLRSSSWPRNVVVTYLRGINPPSGAGIAVEQLSRQLMMSKCGNAACVLPSNLKSRSRNGDTVTFEAIPEGKLNIPLVDLWVSVANGVISPSSTWSPDFDDPDMFAPAGVIS